MEAALRVTEMDGREFIRQSPKTTWTEPFEPYTSPAEMKRREKEARRRREQGLPPASPSVTVCSRSETQLVDHYIMNLPDSALEFLDAFTGLYDPLTAEPGFVEAVEKRGLPMVHIYCFTREFEPDKAQTDVCEVRHPSVGLLLSPIDQCTRGQQVFSVIP